MPTFQPRLRPVVLLVSLLARTSSAEPAASPLHGALDSGPYGVGFTTITLADPTRPEGPKRDAGGAAVEVSRRARRLDVQIWYPAAASPAAPMMFADAMVAHVPGSDAESLRTRDAAVRRFFTQFGAVDDATWQRLRAASLLARRDAPAAPGRFPLIVGLLRPLSTWITSEHLASHGYVVAMVRGSDPGEVEPGLGLEVPLRDMEFAIPELRKRANVDSAALAALGFSGSGFPQILLAMRHPDVDAVCDLESAIFDDGVLYPLSRGWGFDPLALRTPFLHTYSVPLSARENRFSDFEAMRYAQRYHYLVDAPGIHHWDFATEGMAASTMTRLRGDDAPRLRLAFETTNRYVRTFFDAHVKRDAAALAFMRNDPAANGVPPGLVRFRALPAIEPAPTSETLQQVFTSQGLAAGRDLFERSRARDPQGLVFREATLNRLGYRLMRTPKLEESLWVFRTVTELFPRSPNALDSLAEALEAAGRSAEAADVSRRALDVLAREDLPAAQRDGLKRLLDERLERLRKAGSQP
jgi:hypothetical protein